MKPIRIKIFSGFTQNINTHCESQVNGWLSENPDVEIVMMTQSESMVYTKNEQVERNLTLSILYR